MKKPIDYDQMKKTGGIITLKGQSYVTYKGLLYVAHTHGLKSLETELIDYDRDSNRAIVKATCTGERGSFTDLGDASSKNVNKMMATCVIRMASTRAKARVLRDYLGIGICSLEELPE